MVITMLKTYTLSITIQEGQDEFWEDLHDKSGCDEVLAEIRNCLAERGFAPDTGCHVRLEKFEHRGPMAVAND